MRAGQAWQVRPFRGLSCSGGGERGVGRVREQVSVRVREEKGKADMRVQLVSGCGGKRRGGSELGWRSRSVGAEQAARRVRARGRARARVGLQIGPAGEGWQAGVSKGERVGPGHVVWAGTGQVSKPS